jgi:hypothetical protein
MWRALRLAVVVGLLSPLTVRAEAPKESLPDYARRSQARHAYGAYIKKVKVGWMVDELKLGKYAGKDVLVSVTQSHFSVLTDGERSTTTETTTTWYELVGEGAILAVDSVTKEDGKETVRKAVRKGAGMHQVTTHGKRRTERALPIPKSTLRQSQAMETWLKTAKKGDAFVKWSSEFERDEINVAEKYVFKERKFAVWGGVRVPVFVVHAVVQGARFDAELLADGTPFTAVVGGLMTLKMEKEALAKKLDAAPVDLMAASSIFIDRDLGAARQVDRLVLRVSGLEGFDLPQSHRQRLRKGPEGLELEMARDHRVGKALPLRKKEREKHLKATARIQSEHEAIRVLARRIVGAERDPVKVARLLMRWVYRYVRKSYSDNADNALAVLDNRAGDCTEHTLLFVALARAVGLPAREVGGLAYVRGDKPMFGWHAWAEVHDGQQWVSVDPTWGQVYVDATHIKFSEGNDDLAWANVAGKLTMKVLKVEKK